MAEIAYPSIGGPAYAVLDAPCIAFEKYDGSNLRFFWDQKRGWHSSGTRFRWFKAATPTFGEAIALFHRDYARGIVETLRKFKEYRGVNELVAFCEFFGPSTFSGLHREGEAKQLVLFDFFIPGREFVPARDFVAHFRHLPIAKVVYEGNFTRSFMEDVRAGRFGVKEGVVAKGERTRRQRKGKIEKEVWMAKVKTQAWLDELQRRAGESEELRDEFERNRSEQQLPAEPVTGASNE
jgi:hypothetical protein